MKQALFPWQDSVTLIRFLFDSSLCLTLIYSLFLNPVLSFAKGSVSALDKAREQNNYSQKQAFDQRIKKAQKLWLHQQSLTLMAWQAQSRNQASSWKSNVTLIQGENNVTAVETDFSKGLFRFKIYGLASDSIQLLRDQRQLMLESFKQHFERNDSKFTGSNLAKQLSSSVIDSIEQLSIPIQKQELGYGLSQSLDIPFIQNLVTDSSRLSVKQESGIVIDATQLAAKACFAPEFVDEKNHRFFSVDQIELEKALDGMVAWVPGKKAALKNARVGPDALLLRPLGFQTPCSFRFSEEDSRTLVKHRDILSQCRVAVALP